MLWSLVASREASCAVVAMGGRHSPVPCVSVGFLMAVLLSSVVVERRAQVNNRLVI